MYWLYSNTCFIKHAQPNLIGNTQTNLTQLNSLTVFLSPVRGFHRIPNPIIIQICFINIYQIWTIFWVQIWWFIRPHPSSQSVTTYKSNFCIYRKNESKPCCHIPFMHAFTALVFQRAFLANINKLISSKMNRNAENTRVNTPLLCSAKLTQMVQRCRDF